MVCVAASLAESTSISSRSQPSSIRPTIFINIFSSAEHTISSAAYLKMSPTVEEITDDVQDVSTCGS